MNLIAFLLFCGGIYTTFQLIRDVILGTKSVSWPFTDGQITRSETTFVKLDEGGCSVFRVSYTYKVCEKVYSSSVRHIGGGDIVILSHPQGISWKYPLGAHVKVYYDPSMPEVATLETGVSVGGVVMGLISIGILVGSGFMFLPDIIFGR